MVLARGTDGCIDVCPKHEWEERSARAKSFSALDENARAFRRLIFSGAQPASIDKQGRMVLPKDLRAFAGITDEVVLAGQDDYLELWAPEKWAPQETQGSNLIQIAQKLEKSGSSRPTEKGNA